MVRAAEIEGAVNVTNGETKSLGAGIDCGSERGVWHLESMARKAV